MGPRNGFTIALYWGMIQNVHVCTCNMYNYCKAYPKFPLVVPPAISDGFEMRGIRDEKQWTYIVRSIYVVHFMNYISFFTM